MSAITQAEGHGLEKIERGFRLAHLGSADGALASKIHASNRADRRADFSTWRNLYQRRDSEEACPGISELSRQRALPLHRPWAFTFARV